MSVASRKLHLAALRHWLDWLCQKGVLPFNPAASVRGPKLVVREGKTPVLEREQARRLFDSIGDDVVGLRDKALLAVMLFGFVRVSAVCKMRCKDFEDSGGDAWLVLHEKGGKERRIPCHHQARDYLRAYVAAAALETGRRCSRRRAGEPPYSPAMPSADGRARHGEAPGERSRAPLLDLQSLVPGDGHHHPPGKWWTARRCAGAGRAR
jgi:integrase